MLFWSEMKRRIAVEEETAKLNAETAQIKEETARIKARKDQALAESRELAQRLEIEDLCTRVERLEKIMIQLLEKTIADERQSRKRRRRTHRRRRSNAQ